MSDPVTIIPNIGPAVAEACARAGIHTAQDLRDLGPDAAYARLIEAGTRPHFIGFYALALGLQGRPWNDATPDEKIELRTRFDAIKAERTKQKNKSSISLDTALEEIGVVQKSRLAQPTISRPEKK